MHNPQMCGFFNSTFALASSLSRHMYDHDEKKFHCNQCDYSSHFESELEMHKIVHRKNPSYQCMHAKCGKWFHRKWTSCFISRNMMERNRNVITKVVNLLLLPRNSLKNIKRNIGMTIRMNARSVTRDSSTDLG